MSGCTVDTMKHKLDKYLATVPDEPQLQGYTAQRQADSNSLLEMARLATGPTARREDGTPESTIRGGHPWTPWD